MAGFLLWMFRLLENLKEALTRDLAQLRADVEKDKEDLSLAFEATAARCKLADEQLAAQLATYQVHVAETFATKDGVRAAVGASRGRGRPPHVADGWRVIADHRPHRPSAGNPAGECGRRKTRSWRLNWSTTHDLTLSSKLNVKLESACPETWGQ